MNRKLIGIILIAVGIIFLFIIPTIVFPNLKSEPMDTIEYYLRASVNTLCYISMSIIISSFGITLYKKD